MSYDDAELKFYTEILPREVGKWLGGWDCEKQSSKHRLTRFKKRAEKHKPG